MKLQRVFQRVVELIDLRFTEFVEELGLPSDLGAVGMPAVALDPGVAARSLAEEGRARSCGFEGCKLAAQLLEAVPTIAGMRSDSEKIDACHNVV